MASITLHYDSGASETLASGAVCRVRHLSGVDCTEIPDDDSAGEGWDLTAAALLAELRTESTPAPQRNWWQIRNEVDDVWTVIDHVATRADAERSDEYAAGAGARNDEDVAANDADRDAHVTRTRCACGEWSGTACDWTGDNAELVTIEWMPEHLRASHVAAGNRGTYPANGAQRLRVSPECADRMIDEDGEWCERVG